MSNKAKTITLCVECKNPFRVSIGSTVSICPDCLTRKKRSIYKASEDLKIGISYTKKIEF